MAENTKLFTPLKLGSSQLSHRIAMAPMTRFRATADNVPTEAMATYYSQRACVPGTLILTEGTFLSFRTGGYANVPGLWTLAQLDGWRRVTDAVHARGGKVWCQLWATGRTANPGDGSFGPIPDDRFDYANGVAGPSAVPVAPGYPMPRALTEDEIWEIIGDYTAAAKNAVEVAGFDGVEVHGANGYLIDQFTQDTSNQRTDGWGGSVEKRARFGIEVCKAVVAAVGAERVGIRLSPWNKIQIERMENLVPQFSYLISEISKLQLTYLHLVEPRVHAIFDVEPPEEETLEFALKAWGKERPVLVAGGYTPELAVTAIEEKYIDYKVVVVFGRHYVSTPDLVYRLKKGIEFNPYDRTTFYINQKRGDSLDKGYTDYSFSKQFLDKTENRDEQPTEKN